MNSPPYPSLSEDLRYRLRDVALGVADGYVVRHDLRECLPGADATELVEYLASQVREASQGRMDAARVGPAFFKDRPADDAIAVVVWNLAHPAAPRLLTVTADSPGVRAAEMGAWPPVPG